MTPIYLHDHKSFSELLRIIERYWRSFKYECVYHNNITEGLNIHQELTKIAHCQLN